LLVSANAFVKLLALGLVYGVVRTLDLLVGTRRRVGLSALAGLLALTAVLALKGQRSSPPNQGPGEAPEELRKRYDGLAAVEVHPRTAGELQLAIDLSVDVWSEQHQVQHPLVVVLTPASINRLAADGVPHSIVIRDIQAAADEEQSRLELRLPAVLSSDWFSEYRDVQEVSDRMDLLSERHGSLSKLRRLGTSIEGWPIRSMEISRGGKIGIVLNGGLHAREWISVMVNMCIADRLLDAAETNPRIDKILDSVSFSVAPLANPDGYVHSWNVDRYWRKNRRGGHGVDLNRNYGVAWGQRGSSGSRYSQTYRGKSAFSEPETQAMRNLFEGKDIAAHIDFHSFSQLILYPWNYKTPASPHAAKLAAMADRMSSAMFAQHGEQYKVLAGAGFYPASGTFSDWSYGEAGALSYTVELRPSKGGRGGFVLPPEQIVATCDESMAAVLELAEWMIKDAASPNE
jgi:hypothetical protein